MAAIRTLVGGNPSDLVFVKYTMPPLNLNLIADLQFGFPPLIAISLRGGVIVKANFTFGYDASGIVQFLETENPLYILMGSTSKIEWVELKMERTSMKSE